MAQNLLPPYRGGILYYEAIMGLCLRHQPKKSNGNLCVFYASCWCCWFIVVQIEIPLIWEEGWEFPWEEGVVPWVGWEDVSFWGLWEFFWGRIGGDAGCFDWDILWSAERLAQYNNCLKSRWWMRCFTRLCIVWNFFILFLGKKCCEGDITVVSVNRITCSLMW